jgi:iron-sulfur cluster assembly accessory protein
MQYGLTFENGSRDDDEQIECEGFKVLIDPMSLPFLDGTQVDYSDSLMSGGFKINNPQAKTTCGCGQSFSA